MEQAIVTGATGLIGTALVRHLTSVGIEVLCIGRRELKGSEITSHFGGRVEYIQCLMEDIDDLPALVKGTAFQVGTNCAFFHFAWGTKTGLTLGTLEEQLENATASALSVKVAKTLGCSKFINSGSQEESFIGEFLSSGSKDFLSMQSNYALAKIASREMCKMTAYLEKISYIHTRLSAPLSPDLLQKSYIAGTLKAILRGENYDPPKNNNYFDIISTEDVALAFELIGKFGTNKADYFIGTGQTLTLSDYFRYFKQNVEGLAVPRISHANQDETVRLFNTCELRHDTGFESRVDSFEIVKFRNHK